MDKGIDAWLKNGYNIDIMAYTTTEQRREKLEQAFKEKCSDRWEEYELLSKYENKEKKIHLRHKACGHEFWARAGNFQRGSGCPKCAYKIISVKLKESKGSTFNDFLKEQTDYVQLSGYIDSKTAVRLLCKKCSKEFDFYPFRFLSMVRHGLGLCPHCNKEVARKRLILPIDEANTRLEDKNPEYKFVEFTRAGGMAKVLHKNCGHIFDARAYYFLAGNGHCPNCTTNISRQEKEIFAWLVSLGLTPERSVRKIRGVSEIDIYLKDKKIGIEFDGHYWHSIEKLSAPEKRTGKPRMSIDEAKQYHIKKTEACEKYGIHLIHILEDEWTDNKTLVKAKLSRALGLVPEDAPTEKEILADRRWYSREDNIFLDSGYKEIEILPPECALTVGECHVYDCGKIRYVKTF